MCFSRSLLLQLFFRCFSWKFTWFSIIPYAKQINGNFEILFLIFTGFFLVIKRKSQIFRSHQLSCNDLEIFKIFWNFLKFLLWFFFLRKALKKYNPIRIDASESEEFKAILNEIATLEKLSSKSEYVINYLDSFFTLLGDEYKEYHVVNDLYNVNIILFNFQF